MLHVSFLHANVGFRSSSQRVDISLSQRQLPAGQPRKAENTYLATGYGFTGRRQKQSRDTDNGSCFTYGKHPCHKGRCQSTEETPHTTCRRRGNRSLSPARDALQVSALTLSSPHVDTISATAIKTGKGGDRKQ